MDADRSLADCNSNFQNTYYFSKSNFMKIKGIMYDREFQKGERLFLEGDEAKQLYLLIKGVVKLTKTTDDGKELVLNYFRPGDLFGELEGFNVEKCSLSAETVQHCVVGVIQQADMESLLYQHGDLAIEFLKWVTQLHRVTQYKLRDLLFYGKNGALASTLIRMVNTYGIKGKHVIHFSVHFSNAELASMIGASRETVNRMLHQLKKEDVIDYDLGAIMIKDLNHLRNLCHCEDCPIEICRL